MARPVATAAVGPAGRPNARVADEDVVAVKVGPVDEDGVEVPSVVVGQQPPADLDLALADGDAVGLAVRQGGPHRDEALGAIRTVDDERAVVVDVNDGHALKRGPRPEGARAEALAEHDAATRWRCLAADIGRFDEDEMRSWWLEHVLGGLTERRQGVTRVRGDGDLRRGLTSRWRA